MHDRQSTPTLSLVTRPVGEPDLDLAPDVAPDLDPDEPCGRLTCSRELDAGTSRLLLNDVGVLLSLGYRRVVLDLDGMQFCDLAGLDALLAVRRRVLQHQGELLLQGTACQTLTLLCRLLGLTDQLDRRTSTARTPAWFPA